MANPYGSNILFVILVLMTLPFHWAWAAIKWCENAIRSSKD